MAEQNKSIIIKMEQVAEQRHEGILRLVGFAKVKEIIKIINILDLEANPRESKTGSVTHAIQESMEDTPELFPFKTKGILLGASRYDELDRKRYRIYFGRPDTEGILDGGHNALAIGMYVLERACDFAGEKYVRASNWGEFKEEWNDKYDLVEEYQASLRKREDETGTFTPLDVLVPIELLLPASDEDIDLYRTNLLDICAARNNNVQLSTATKANKRGYFDALRSVFEDESPDLARRIEWKTNDGGEIKVDRIVSLAWIPLKLVVDAAGPFVDEDGKTVDAPSPVTFYSGKATCLSRFERLMSSPEVTISPSSDYHRELRNSAVLSALEITAKIPELYDYIYENFADCYNAAGGKFGRIEAVKALNDNKGKKLAPFSKREVSVKTPDGFIAPLIYGLQALMEVYEKDGEMDIRWKVKNPMVWLYNNLSDVFKGYWNVIPMCNYDPQKVGKSQGSYGVALNAYKLVLAGLD